VNWDNRDMAYLPSKFIRDSVPMVSGRIGLSVYGSSELLQGT
jgi:hypothetical protein